MWSNVLSPPSSVMSSPPMATVPPNSPTTPLLHLTSQFDQSEDQITQQQIAVNSVNGRHEEYQRSHQQKTQQYIPTTQQYRPCLNSSMAVEVPQPIPTAPSSRTSYATSSSGTSGTSSFGTSLNHQTILNHLQTSDSSYPGNMKISKHGGHNDICHSPSALPGSTSRPLGLDTSDDLLSEDFGEVERRVGGGLNLDRIFISDDMRAQFLDSVPNVLLTGLPRAGKTSISEVVYRKSSPHETMFMAQTQTLQILRVANTNLVQFNLVDCPGLLFQDPSADSILFSNAQSLIFVIDAQNEPFGAEIGHCRDLFKRAWRWNPQINFEVFIHKVDGDFFSVDEVRAECQRDIHDKLMSYLHEGGVAANVVFYSTSIYDQTVFEACSRVIQRLIPEIGTLERLLDILVASCKMEKAFLIDVLSKTFIATDSSPFDPFNYELCADMVDVVIEISCIYGDVDSRESAHTELNDDKNENEDRTFSFSRLPDCQTRQDENSDEQDTSQGSTICLIQLNSGHILYLREVDRLLALACVVREEHFDRQYLVDHNIRVFRDAMLEFSQQHRTPDSLSSTSVPSRD